MTCTCLKCTFGGIEMAVARDLMCPQHGTGPSIGGRIAAYFSDNKHDLTEAEQRFLAQLIDTEIAKLQQEQPK